MERDWSTFVSRLGRAVESRRCNRLDRCLRDPEANSLWDAQTDAHLRLDSIDCADLPYILRAYYAYKRRLPFGFVSNVRAMAGNDDARYALGLRPSRWSTWRAGACRASRCRRRSWPPAATSSPSAATSCWAGRRPG